MSASIVFSVFAGTFLLAGIAVWIARFIQERRESPSEPVQELPLYSRRSLEEDETLVVEAAELSTIAVLNWLLARFDFVERVKTKLLQADLNWSVGRVIAAMLLSGAMGGAVFSQLVWIPAWALVAIAILFGIMPYLYIGSMRNRRLRKIEEQFPEAMESVARAMRAGYAFAGAIDNVARQSQNPLRKELSRAVNEAALGVPWERALESLAERLPIQEVHLFVAAVQVQSRAGGDLSEVLEKFAENMREASALRGEVRSLSSQGRFAGYILTALPVAIALAMMTVAPDFMQPLFQEEIGRTLLLCGAGGLVAAHFIIRKLVDIRL
jgi:tight adherence protein B